MNGSVKTWKADRGFGFITPDDGGKDLFFHITDVVTNPRAPGGVLINDRVEFQTAPGKNGKGPKATHVRIL